MRQTSKLKPTIIRRAKSFRMKSGERNEADDDEIISRALSPSPQRRSLRISQAVVGAGKAAGSMFGISSILTCAALTLSLDAALTGSAAAQAQYITVRIPFNFSANDQKVPAGIYRISLQAPRYLSLVNAQSTKNQYLMLVQPARSKTVRMGAA
jgi:hypothetical protein